MTKYHAKPTTIDNIRFDSQKEATRYSQLKLLLSQGKISDLRWQVRYKLSVNDQLICAYVADFVYTDNETGKEVVEDVKGVRTPIYRLKSKLMDAIYGIKIYET